MKPKEYYRSTRMVDTMHWTIEMAMNFAEEYHEFKNRKLMENCFEVRDKRDNRLIAIFRDSEHAEKYGKSLIGEFAIVVKTFNERFLNGQ